MDKKKLNRLRGQIFAVWPRNVRCVALMEKASPKTVFGERVKTGNKIHTELSVMRIIFFIITLKLGIL